MKLYDKINKRLVLFEGENEWFGLPRDTVSITRRARFADCERRR